MQERDFHLLQPGKILNKRYIIESVLGEGGFGITYKGTDQFLGVYVAIKEFYPHGIVVRNNSVNDDVTVTNSSQQESFQRGREKFLDEAMMIAKFSSQEGIVNFTDFFEENNTVYIVMEYLEGVTLKEYLRQNGTLETEEVLDLFVPLIEALDAVHRQGLIHRDISPDNIMLMENGKVKLMDFGAARAYSEFGEKSLSIVLKPGYAPEEQYRSRGVQGPWTDIYALSATMYRCITGITPEDSIQRMVEDDIKKPSELGISISGSTENAIMKGLAVSAKNRYKNLKAFSEDLYGNTRRNMEETVFEENADLLADEVNNQRFKYQDNHSGNDIQKPKKKKRSPLIYAGAAAGVIVLCWIMYISFTIKVPDLYGMEYSEAVQLVTGENNSLKIEKYDERFSDYVEAGHIVFQDTKAGSRLARGSTIYVTVSLGKETFSVPDLTGQDYEQARVSLEENNLMINKTNSEWSDTVEKDHIISQSLPAGTMAEKGTSVDVVVSKGVEQVSVPNLHRLSVKDAKKKLKASKLKMSTGTDRNGGYILSQDPELGKMVVKGTKIKVHTSDGPEPDTGARLTFAVNYNEDDSYTNEKTIKESKTVYVHFTAHNMRGGESVKLNERIMNSYGLVKETKFQDGDGDDIVIYDGSGAWLCWQNGLFKGEYIIEIIERKTGGTIGRCKFKVE